MSWLFAATMALLGPFVFARGTSAFVVSFTDINPSSSTLDASDPDGASGGRVNGLASVAGDNQTFYAASEWGGLYKTTDRGRNWFRLNRHLPVATWEVKVDPTAAGKVYATSFYDGRTAPISGIEVSSDAGVTWTHPASAHPNPALEGTASDNTPDPTFNCSNARRTEPSAFGIAIRPDATQNVFIGTNCGIAISNDSGATWRFVDPTPADAADDVWDVVAQAGGIVDICGDDGHLRSTDSGNTWTLGAGLPAGRCSLAVSPDETYVLFAAAADNNLYESDNAGATWTNLGTPGARRQGRIPFIVTNQRMGSAFDLWFGDVSVYRGGCTTPAMPMQGGANRCPAGRAVAASPPPAGWAGPFTRTTGAHDDVGDLVLDSAVTVDACPMIMSSDGGVYRNTDLGAGCQNPAWEQPDVTPHALWVSGMDGADQAGDVNEDLYIGCQDDGTFATTNAGAASPGWFNRDCCDSFDIVADATRVVSSLCCGYSLRVSNPGMVSTMTVNSTPPGGVPAFNFPDFLDTFGANQYVAVTSSGAFITTNITVNPVVWTQLGVASTPVGGFCAVQAALSGGTPTFYAQTFCGTTNNSIFEVTGSSQLWRYDGTAATGTWQRVDNNSGLVGGFGVVAVAPSDPNRLYASNLNPAGVQMVFSTDGGTTWNRDTELDGLMTGQGVFRYSTQRGPTPLFPGFNGYSQPSLLAFDPQNSNIVVAGGRDSGVFWSMNGGRNWALLTDPFNSGNSGIPHLPRPRFAYFDDEPSDVAGESNFYVGTQGRGVWRVAAMNTPPVCNADGPYVAECALPTTLNGSGSSDPDGDPLSFNWSGPFDGGTATGSMPSVQFSTTGSFTVNLDVTDGPSNATCSSAVTVRDTIPPVLPPNVTAECTSPAGTPVDIGVPTDLCDPNPTFSNNAPALFPLGVTPVMWTVTDASGNTTTGTQLVTVVDTTPPVLSVSVSPDILWPPHHQLINVHATIMVSDICDPAPVVRLVSITSSEPDSGTGPNDKPNDIQGAAFGTDDRTFRLRAEHSPGGLRTYTITYTATDASGNSTTQQVTARVPKSRPELISRDGEAGNGASTAVAISTDGRFVAFPSDATNLVGGDTNDLRDVFVRDRMNRTTERVSVNSANEQANGASHAQGGSLAISGDGRFVAFYSAATNLVSADDNRVSDVFVRDRSSATTERVSVGIGGEADGPSQNPSISENGRFVAFQSQASNLVLADSNGVSDIFVFDRMTQVTERVCDSVEGNGPSVTPSISPDGTFVAFASAATNLVAGDSNRRIDVFVCNRSTGAIERVSVSSAGAEGDGDSILPAISREGTVVAFKSLADNLVPDDRNGLVDVFARDRVSGVTERISVNRRGGDSDDVSFPPGVSHDGRFVAFGSLATNLALPDTNAASSVFVRDRQAGLTLLVDVNDDGEQGNRGTLDVAPALTGDGAQVGFVSLASNLDGPDNEVPDVFVVCNPFIPSLPLVAPSRFVPLWKAARPPVRRSEAERRAAPSRRWTQPEP